MSKEILPEKPIPPPLRVVYEGQTKSGKLPIEIALWRKLKNWANKLRKK